MKLYGTVTSERASEGQGGNDYLQIQLQNDKQIVFGSITVLPNGHVYGSIHGTKIDILPIFTETEKGVKAKNML